MSYIDERSPLLRAVLLVAGLVIIAAGMKATATVVNLILLSILLATTLVPVTVFLNQRGMGRGAAIALTAVLALVGGALLIMVLTRSISRLSENLPTYQAARRAGRQRHRQACCPGHRRGPGDEAGPGQDHGP